MLNILICWIFITPTNLTKIWHPYTKNSSFNFWTWRVWICSDGFSSFHSVNLEREKLWFHQSIYAEKKSYGVYIRAMGWRHRNVMVLWSKACFNDGSMAVKTFVFLLFSAFPVKQKDKWTRGIIWSFRFILWSIRIKSHFAVRAITVDNPVPRTLKLVYLIFLWTHCLNISFMKASYNYAVFLSKLLSWKKMDFGNVIEFLENSMNICKNRMNFRAKWCKKFEF